MNAKPLISILTPTFNHENYVGSFIESLLAQNYYNWELIIVDDCSTDNNISEIRKYSDPRIHLFLQDFNQGPGAALNRAFSESKGEIIVDMASDDMLYPDYFEYIIKTFSENNGVGVIYSSLDVIDENNKVYKKNVLPKSYTRIDFLKDLFYKGNVLFSPGMSVRREVYSRIIPMDVSMVQHQDYQWHVLFLGMTDCKVAEKTFVKYRIPRNNRSSLGTLSKKELNRDRLEIGSLMDSFLLIKDLDLIKKITTSNLCDKLSNKMTDFIWGMEAFNCKSIEKRQWGYSVIKRCFNDCLFREELNKINFNFHSFLKLAENQYFNDFTFYGRKIKLFLKYCLGKQ